MTTGGGGGSNRKQRAPRPRNSRIDARDADNARRVRGGGELGRNAIVDRRRRKCN